MRKVLYILGQLDDADIAWMGQNGRKRQLAKGERLIEEGRQTEHLFIVLDGQVDVQVAGVGTVASLSSGEILGEMSFVDKAPPSATVVAVRDARVLELGKRLMEERLASNPAFAGRFYKALAIFLADRLRTTTQRKNGAGAIIPEDELDDMVLDGVSMAGLRFQHLLGLLDKAQEA
ncbi:cyclic nucleotide-binding domain-containing protein [Rhizobium sp. RU36D]|uniref:cyclic nucleotide-binding domain-containing protein n=1 Tax=Rhizobium sp. RU36D TaxID=1907415 RepID=UPI0009D89BB4|nr:cyclic nucleotide-binding domain-containing protein [Rhizobium sp. RU36D]SMD17747.1 Cyclic nucleotide-binding domain-containing protein [Rhizobium sp. RU36D]